MSKREIHIERLQIRMRGIDARRARAAVDDLGQELLSQLSAPGALDGLKGTMRISKVDAGTAHVGSEMRAGELRRRIAKQVTESFLTQRRKGAKLK